MNKRIKLLAEQAYLYQEHDTFLIAALENFAELIVRECIQTIQMGITRDGHDTEKYLRSMKHIKEIKEHFGVEE
jgi:hypothetical protein